MKNNLLFLGFSFLHGDEWNTLHGRCFYVQCWYFDSFDLNIEFVTNLGSLTIDHNLGFKFLNECKSHEKVSHL